MTDVVNQETSGSWLKAARISDPVAHPSHYAEGWSNGAEVIDITENLNFNRGNAVKYIARAGKKNPDADLEDLRKAKWYLEREIYRLDADEARDPILEHRMAQDVVDLDEPRVWESIFDVPAGVIVSDIENDRWQLKNGNPHFRAPSRGAWVDITEKNIIRNADNFGPFTEVL